MVYAHQDNTDGFYEKWGDVRCLSGLRCDKPHPTRGLWVGCGLPHRSSLQPARDGYPLRQAWKRSTQASNFSGAWAFFHTPAVYLLASNRVG